LRPSGWAERWNKSPSCWTSSAEPQPNLARAKEEVDEDEIEFAARDAAIDFRLEECDYHCNKRLERWSNAAR
jgi:hypothetical protein